MNQAQAIHQAFQSEIEPSREEKIQWPVMEQEAFEGLCGEVVSTLAPETEADSNALLLQLLVAAGNIMGRGPHFMVGGARHGMNLYCCLVGISSRGRKGTSWAELAQIFRATEAFWFKKCQTSGLSSGEGLVYAIRDQREEDKVTREKGKVVGYERIVVDGGVEDKRLLVHEGEFGRVLAVMSREGNTLSATLRQAWDGGDLRGMAKNSPDRCTEPHVSIIGHVTKEELLKLLSQNDTSNGFANRFLWCCVRRSKRLPDGGNLSQVAVAYLVQKLEAAIGKAKHVGCINRDPGARELWHATYSQLSEGHPGLLGFVTSRSEAQVARLACLYALLDGSDVVKVQHLEAALAVWEFCEDSARWIFGAATGDPLADRLLAMLRDSVDGMSRTAIYNALGRNTESERIGCALALLESLELARKESKREQGQKRPTELWFSELSTLT